LVEYKRLLPLFEPLVGLKLLSSVAPKPLADVSELLLVLLELVWLRLPLVDGWVELSVALGEVTVPD